MKFTHYKSWLCQIAAVSVSTCLAATAFAQSHPNSLWIGTDNTTSRDILNIDRTGTLLRSIPLTEATGIAIDAAHNRIFFGDDSGKIVARDLDTLTAGQPLTNGVDGGFYEGMAFDGSFIWRASAYDTAIVRLSPIDGSRLSSFTLGYFPIGVAWDGTCLWVSRYSATGPITRYNTNGVPTGQQFSVSLPGDSAGGLAYDTMDGTLWVGATDHIYHYSTNGTQLGSFSLPVSPAEGRFVDGLAFQGPASGPNLSIDFYAGITLTGTVGPTNSIQYVTNLGDTNWITLTNLVLPQSPYLFFDVTSPHTQRRFYRDVQLP
jgi:hypothetical protein